MPGKQRVNYTYPGLAVEGVPVGEERGVYFTDEFMEVRFTFANESSPPKRIKGDVTVFYGFGPSGLEGQTPETISLDIPPKQKVEKVTLKRLLGIQGNGVIGLLLPPPNSWSETANEVLLQQPGTSMSSFHTLYTFTIMDREYYARFHEYPATLAERIAKLTILLVVLTLVFIGISIWLGLRA
jgi:hypothetical protein